MAGPSPQRLCTLLGCAENSIGGALAVMLVGLLIAGSVACNRRRGDESIANLSKLASRPKACPPEGAELQGTDVDGDGKVDALQARRNGKLVCDTFDLNFDGKIDVKRFYDEVGQRVEREERDLDFSGTTDQILLFVNGEEWNQLDTNFDGRIDTRVVCRKRAVQGVQRDRTGNGNIDSWEIYESGQLKEIHYDSNNDAKADRWELYERSRLRGVKIDTNYDGRADREERFSKEATQRKLPSISCSGHAEPKPSTAALEAGKRRQG